MRSRQLRKKIEVWQTASVSDGFGGFTVSETLLSSQWASISTAQANSRDLSGRNITDIGIVDPSKSISVTVRYNNNISYNVETMFIKYRGNKYTIIVAPVNNNFEDGFITFLATQETNKLNIAG